MRGLFRSFFTVSSYTALSRILGFIRDIFIAKYLGSTVTADAFFVAFRLPNFFRRVLAEGAYSAALIPVFSGAVIDSKDDDEAADFVENTMSLLLFVTVILTIIFYFGMPYIIQVLAPGFTSNKEAFDLAVHFGKIIFPYLIFISLVAHFTSIMNVHGKFAAGSLAPSILNISFILSLFILTPQLPSAGHALSYGVLIGGLFQFLLMYRAVLIFYRPRIKLPQINDRMKKFFTLFIPGIVGSGVIQLNIIIGTVIASFLPIGAISHIYYADRLNQLPLAIFGIAMGIVLLPSLSKAIKQNDQKEVQATQNRSLEFCILISIPSAIGLYILSKPIIYILFERGAFLSSDTLYTAKVLSMFALGLPAYILIKVLVTCFFAREDTKTPLYVSIASVVINIILSLIFIQSMRETGIALATAISAWVNALLLYVILKMKDNITLDSRLINHGVKTVICSIIMGGACYYLNLTLFPHMNMHSTTNNVAALIIAIMACNIIYMTMIFMLKVLTIDELKGFIKN
ncbi:MAG: murein biosynthesis integral membrane protein MurJ [Pelagibacteraceae bacterium]|jgi:putative peptidoglycan lipid II flippase|nr:murein biosynthesis integral membrane protein MurJ [Pelagibacteraceae bacterium]HJL57947.1 murein biosynthesis integral membrane protein MurJ [Alphaproteobacteria bacterium]MBO6469931.1 murein biosynthesis integral membrane protein MurJ [Pelagibacteraceae bacterium]MBO6470691.1 murein biosynthesis integral membrane protein MurJ [Pelagibacteraceae bacterium]MBO6471820.1 murein biosynthesis integral membrane protein MurJ [Pelagibacteraceae bacterium]